jgi:hypothetical protein
LAISGSHKLWVLVGNLLVDYVIRMQSTWKSCVSTQLVCNYPQNLWVYIYSYRHLMCFWTFTKPTWEGPVLYGGNLWWISAPYRWSMLYLRPTHTHTSKNSGRWFDTREHFAGGERLRSYNRYLVLSRSQIWEHDSHKTACLWGSSLLLTMKWNSKPSSDERLHGPILWGIIYGLLPMIFHQESIDPNLLPAASAILAGFGLFQCDPLGHWLWESAKALFFTLEVQFVVVSLKG